ncbi:pectate lyase [Gaoshiqia sp. Z1-71]|uniref:pectate lyase n=1 Tax=Gaoshiqia hydrogeniformans TaxID=3290090 RepID=UPI003BF7D1A9
MKKKTKQFFRPLVLFCLTLVGTIIVAESIHTKAEAANPDEQKWSGALLRKSPVWYSGVEAREIANNVIQYQSDAGAWPKNTNIAAQPESDDYLQKIRTGNETNTIDNGATTTPLRFLALMIDATGEATYKESFFRGLDYLLAAQYKNGGWPQFYPLRDHGYYSEITFNDNAMMNVMFFLRDIAGSQTPYHFVDDVYREKAAEAVDKGLKCILKTQIRVNGKLTAWCAQYDQHSLQPAWARNFEPPSVSGSESVPIVRFLMDIDHPSEKVKQAIEGAINWFSEVQITGMRFRRGVAADGERDAWVEADPEAKPLWARFYEIETNKPIFTGRDQVIRYSFAEIERERRVGYSYYGNWPEELINEDYPKWKAKHPEKPRVFVLTDIENEPDDAMSMVRFLVYANHWDIEGLAATTSIHQKNKVATWRIREIVDAYGKVRDNLEKHETGFPTGDNMQAVITEGLPEYGMLAVGKGKDSPASEALIASVDHDDQRPVWVTVWGGPNVLAQALWKIRETRSKEELAAFVSKLRVYTISDQDDSGPWIRKEFPDLFYVVSPGFNAGGAYHHATWSGISGDYFHARCDGADFSLVTNEWLDTNIRRKGPLGAQYPRWDFLMEGDTPSFLNLINNGLSNPEHPEWGGWGGRYEQYTPRMQKWHLEPETRPIWSDADDEVLGIDGRWHDGNHETIWRWREAFQNDFAARMDWTILPFEKANHPPLAILDHDQYLTATPGERINLSAKSSTDPDGDALSYHWFCYAEAGSFPVSSARSGQPVEIKNFDQPEAWLMVPTQRVMPPGLGTIHIILAVTDHGSPRLTRYKRVIVNVSK